METAPLRIVIAAEDDYAATDRIDRWLASRLSARDDLPPLSRSRLKALILDGRVSEGGRTISNPSAPVKPGQTYAIIVPEAVSAIPEAEAIGLTVIYEDNDLIVIDKPAGMVVHPAPGSEEGTLVNALLAHCGDSLSGIGGVRRPGIVHRIDKDTSGLIVAAKTDAAHQGLTVRFAAHAIERSYRALVWGTPHPLKGRIEAPIGRSPRNRKKMAVLHNGGRHAVTHYATLHRYGDTASQVECRLETGRTHQIRVHMAHLGHSLVGDPVYGTNGARRKETPAVRLLRGFPRQALHAVTLGFEHPVKGTALRFESPLPADLGDLLDRLGACEF
jgi:23S rRNA pseudouridine1911/1915/1917 synthase